MARRLLVGGTAICVGAAVALVTYAFVHKWRTQARSTEAMGLVLDVYAIEEARHEEYGYYPSWSHGLSDLCPRGAPGPYRDWDPHCGRGVDGPWAQAGDVFAERRVMARVAAVSNRETGIPEEVVGTVAMPPPSARSWAAAYVEWPGNTGNSRALRLSNTRDVVVELH